MLLAVHSLTDSLAQPINYSLSDSLTHSINHVALTSACCSYLLANTSGCIATCASTCGLMCSVVIAVGYMFRYSAMAQAAKKILKEHNATPLAVIARYACGYSDIKKKDWSVF